MKAHFGSRAESDDLLLSFDQQKKDFQKLEELNPRYRLTKKYQGKDMTVGDFEDYTKGLIQKTREAR